MLVLVKLNDESKHISKNINSFVKRKIWKKAKIFIPAGQAKVAPPISSILGQFGINLLEFCDKFNSKTRHMSSDLTFLVFVTVYSNKNFNFLIKPLLLNDLFYSFQLEDSIKNKNLFIVLFYKIYLVFAYSRNSNLLEIKTFSSRSLGLLKQIVGYSTSFVRLKNFYNSKNVVS